MLSPSFSFSQPMMSTFLEVRVVLRSLPRMQRRFNTCLEVWAMR